MTAREHLREAARLLENAHDYHAVPVHRDYAAALRTLADRLDAEMASYEARADLNVKVCLSRLDADLNTTTPTRRAGT